VKFILFIRFQLKVLEETNSIVLHSKELNIKENGVSLTLVGDAHESVGLSKIRYDKDVDFLIIDVKTPLKKGSKYLLEIPFEGHISTGLVGFYRSSYVNAAAEKE
jgi:aminopeptidase N